MSIASDVSINTLIISGVVALVGYALKGALWATGAACKKLTETLISTIADVKVLDAKLADLIQTVGDVQKIKTDLNMLYGRLKDLEDKYRSAP